MKKCIVCEGVKWHKYISIVNNKYDVLICNQCSLTKLNPLPTKRELDNYYEGVYRKDVSSEEYVSTNTILYESWRANRVIKIIEPYFSKEYKVILDIGCSTGTLLSKVSELSPLITPETIYGIEMNDNYRNYILNKGLAACTNITNQDITKYDKKNLFDFISIVHVLEHLLNPREILETLYKLLNDNGLLYIEVPNLKTPYNHLKTKYFAIYHLYYFSEVTLGFLLEDIGFNILREEKNARTSICFVCNKGPSLKKRKNISNKEFDVVLAKLNSYRTIYPLIFLRKKLVNILDYLKVKKILKKCLGL